MRLLLVALLLLGAVLYELSSYSASPQVCPVRFYDPQYAGEGVTHCPAGRVVTGGERSGFNVNLECSQAEAVCQ